MSAKDDLKRIDHIKEKTITNDRCSGDPRLADGDFSLEETHSTPLGNVIRVKVAENGAGLVGLHFRKGDWMESVAVSVNGSVVDPAEEPGFLRVTGRFAPGDVIVLTFDRRRRWASVQSVENAGGMRRAFYGPLLLGADGEAAGLDELKPVYHLLDPAIWERGSGRLRVLFD